MAPVDDLALRVGRPARARPRQDGIGLMLAGWGLVAVCTFLAAVSAWQFTDHRGNPLDDLIRVARGDPGTGHRGVHDLDGVRRATCAFA